MMSLFDWILSGSLLLPMNISVCDVGTEITEHPCRKSGRSSPVKLWLTVKSYIYINYNVHSVVK